MPNYPFDYSQLFGGIDYKLLQQAAEDAKIVQATFRDLKTFDIVGGLRLDPSLLTVTQDLTALKEAIGAWTAFDRRQLETLTEMGKVSHALTATSAARMIEAVDASRVASEPFLEMQKSVADSLAFTRLAAGNLAGLDATILGASLEFRKHHDHTLANLARMTRSYGRLYEDLRSTEALFEIPRLVIDRPPKEFFLHTGFLEAITVSPSHPAPEAGAEDEADKYDEVAGETERALAAQLDALGSTIAKMWKGAHQALASQNPDRVRHASSSFRELLTHVLHTLAPDGQIKDWSTSEKDFANGRPTRRARLLYIARHVDHDRFGRFLRSDVAAAEELLDLLHKGVHTPEAGFTDAQVRLLALRTDHLLLFLLEVARIS